MIAIRSRSTMEFGRRISTTTRKQMRKYRTFTNASTTRHDVDERTYTKRLSSDVIDEQPVSLSIVVNSFECMIENANHPSIQSDENTESSIPNNDGNDNLSQYQLNRKTSFHLSNIKPIKLLFPSLSSIKEFNKRKSEVLSREYSNDKIMKNSLSVSHNMKYADQLFNSNDILKTLSTESSSDECPRKSYIHRSEQQLSEPTEKPTM
jgi:hypothetical protein